MPRPPAPPLRTFALLAAALLAVLLAPRATDASKPRLRLERLDPTGLGEGKLRAFASVVELEGEVVDGLNSGEFTLLVDDKPAGRATAMQRFAGTNEEVYVAFVVEVAAQYKKAIEPVKTALKEFLEDQPRQFKAMLIAYGSETDVRSPLQPAASLGGPIEDLTCDDDSSDVKMVEAGARGHHRAQARAGAARRHAAAPPDRAGLRRAQLQDGPRDLPQGGHRGARGQGAHPHAGILSGRRARAAAQPGRAVEALQRTFRWAQKQDDLAAQLATLADEVRKQYVLTFKSDLKTLEGHRFSLRHGELRSNRVSGDAFDDKEKEGRDGDGALWKKWWFWVALVFGALVTLYLIGLLLQFLQSRSGQASSGAPKAPRAAAKKAEKAPAKAAPARAAAAGGSTATASGARATLIAIGGALANNRFEVRGTLTVGKAPGHSIVVSDDPSVSSRHCEFGRDNAGFFVRDLGSTNGTFVNNQRVAASGTQRLRDGDIVRLGGNTQFKVRVD